MLIITGPGRSGTSVLALFCRRMGFEPGGAWHESVDAGLEDEQIVRMNDAMLSEIGRTGKAVQTLETYRSAIQNIAHPVIKDPRFTFHPGLLRAWRSVRDDLRVLLTYRTPEHSLKSRKRLPGLLHKNQNTPDIIRRQFADCVETLLAENIPFRMLLFPKFLTQYDRIYTAFSDLGMTFDKAEGARIWESLVDPKKVHFKS